MNRISAPLARRCKPVLGLLALAACLLWIWWPRETTFRQETLMIETGGRALPFTVEIAETPWQKARGLMYRETLGEGVGGMLFLAAEDTDMLMWMKNTPLPLDMLFIDGDGTIIHIAHDTRPYSEDVISAGREVRAVLEIPAGTAKHYKIKPGDAIIHPAFSRHPG